MLTAKEKLIDKFPKKYHKTINKLLTELFICDPNFNENCSLQLPHEAIEYFDEGTLYLDLEELENPLFYLIHEGGIIGDFVEAEGEDFFSFAKETFKVDRVCLWATAFTVQNS